MSALKKFRLGDFDTKPITLAYHKQAIEAQQRAASRLTVPFPAFSLINERASYDAHRAQAERVIEAATDLIIRQIEILRDAAGERTDSANIRTLINEIVSEELYAPDQHFELEAAE